MCVRETVFACGFASKHTENVTLRRLCSHYISVAHYGKIKN